MAFRDIEGIFRVASENLQRWVLYACLLLMKISRSDADHPGVRTIQPAEKKPTETRTSIALAFHFRALPGCGDGVLGSESAACLRLNFAAFLQPLMYRNGRSGPGS
jgi:hypothetical protein